MTRYAIGLGSNQGDRLGHLRRAVAEMGSLGTVSKVSSVYETRPVGGPDQPSFLNAVAVIDSDLGPHDLLERLQGIEDRSGRVRTLRWGPRTLDLDIVSADVGAVTSGHLEIPHPRASEREFVLRPLAEVWPEADVGGVTAAGALLGVGGQGVDRLGRLLDPGRHRRVGVALVAAQVVWLAALAAALYLDGDIPGRPGPRTVTGALVAGVGMVMVVDGALRLGRGLTPMPEPSQRGSLVETGGYALARHPIYGGIVLSFLGLGLLAGSVWAIAGSLGLAGFFYLKTGHEETLLRARYPAYGAYARRVRRRLIPYLF